MGEHRRDLSRADAALLYELSRIWRDRYVITVVDGTWSATRCMLDARPFTAESGQQLRGIIARDNQAWILDAGRHNR